MSQRRLEPVWIRQAFEHANDTGLLSTASAGISEATIRDLWSDAKLALYHGDVGVAETLLRPMAEGNNAYAQCLLGWALIANDDAAAQKDEPILWFRKAAAGGLALAQYSLGVLHADGIGVPRDYAEAERWIHRAVEQGFAPAQNALAGMYLDESRLFENHVWSDKLRPPLSPDNARAFKLLYLAAEQGFAESQCDLGRAYQEGLGVPCNEEKARKWLERAAEQGHARSLRILADRHKKGSKEWVRLLELAVETDEHFWSARELADFYRAGDIHALFHMPIRNVMPPPPGQDLAKAAYWYRFMAERGDAHAQWDLSLMYEKGEGVPQDKKEAVRWCHLAANKGVRDALFALGERYADGRDVPQDSEKAKHLFYQAVEERGGRARDYLYMLRLALILAEGRSLPKDLTEAIRWTTRAGELGAAIEAGRRFLIGQGVPVDRTEAFRWLDIGVRQCFERGGERDISEVATLGFELAHGLQGLPKEFDQGMKYLQSAAERGDGFAITGLGDIYKDAESKDLREAIKWYRLAADPLAAVVGSPGQYPRAADGLESICKQEGVDEDIRNEALEALRSAAENGNRHALLILARLYATEAGRQFPHSWEATRHLDRYCDNRSADAQGNEMEIAETYEKLGEWTRAVKHFELAAAMVAHRWGRDTAMLKLAEMFEQGKGVPQDFATAHMWYNLAAAHGSRDQLASRMETSQVTEAQRMAREWRSRQLAED